MSKINVTPVIARHIDTLESYGRTSKSDVLMFFVLPLCVGGVLVYLQFGFRTDAVNAFLNAFSIFTGLLLNVLVLIFTLTSTAPPVGIDLKMRKELLRQVFVNICFAIIVSVAVVCVALVALSYMRSNSGAITGRGATLLLSALTINFVLTLLMIIKRMYALLDKEIERGGSFRKTA
jgi:hypothetical protein